MIKHQQSDHYLIGVSFIDRKKKTSPGQSADCKNNRNGEIEYLDNSKVDLQINDYKWSTVVKEIISNIIFEKLSLIFNDINEKSKVTFKPIGRKKENKWMNETIYKLILERDKTFEKWKSIPRNNFLKEKY